MGFIDKFEVKDRLETLLDRNQVFFNAGHHYVSFDKYTKNVDVLERFKLHDFLSKQKGKTTLVNLKLIADVHNICEVLNDTFFIGETQIFPGQRLKHPEDYVSEKLHRNGDAIDIYPRTVRHRVYRELQKAVRKTKTSGGRLIFTTHIHLDAMLDRKQDFTRDRGIKISQLYEIGTQ